MDRRSSWPDGRELLARRTCTNSSNQTSRCPLSSQTEKRYNQLAHHLIIVGYIGVLRVAACTPTPSHLCHARRSVDSPWSTQARADRDQVARHEGGGGRVRGPSTSSLAMSVRSCPIQQHPCGTSCTFTRRKSISCGILDKLRLSSLRTGDLMAVCWKSLPVRARHAVSTSPMQRWLRHVFGNLDIIVAGVRRQTQLFVPSAKVVSELPSPTHGITIVRNTSIAKIL